MLAKLDSFAKHDRWLVWRMFFKDLEDLQPRGK